MPYALVILHLSSFLTIDGLWTRHSHQSPPPQSVDQCSCHIVSYNILTFIVLIKALLLNQWADAFVVGFLSNSTKKDQNFVLIVLNQFLELSKKSGEMRTDMLAFKARLVQIYKVNVCWSIWQHNKFIL